MGRVIAVAVACSGGPLPPGGAEESGLRLPVQVWEPNLTCLFSSQPTRVLVMGGGGKQESLGILCTALALSINSVPSLA